MDSIIFLLGVALGLSLLVVFIMIFFAQFTKEIVSLESKNILKSLGKTVSKTLKLMIKNITYILVFMFLVLLVSYMAKFVLTYLFEYYNNLASLEQDLPITSQIHSLSLTSVGSSLAYKDFLTIVTGLLTLIIGATAVGAYFSFKNLRKEEKKLKKYNKQAKNIFPLIFQSMDEDNSVDNFAYKIEGLTDLLQSDKNNKFLYVLRGEQYQLSGKFNQAIADFESALKIDSFFPRAELGIATTLRSKYMLLEIGKLPDKQWRLSDFTCENEFIALKTNLYNGNTDDRKLHEIITHMERAEEYNPKQVFFELGRTYDLAGRRDEALTYYRKAIDTNNIDPAQSNFDAELFYTILWMRINIEKQAIFDKSLEHEIEDIINRLNKTASLAPLFSKRAHALLAYLYTKLHSAHILEKYTDKDLKKLACKSFFLTDDYTLNDIFEIKSMEGTNAISNEEK